MNSMILKGTIIGNGSVVGANSTCCGKYEDESCVYAGSPAKKIRESICWNRKI